MDLIQSIFILFICYYFSLKLGKYLKISQKKITALFILKTIIGLIYIPIAKNLNYDAYGYFFNALNDDTLTLTSTDFIRSITRFLRGFLHLNIFSITFIFTFFGNIGSLFLASNIKTLTKDIRSPLKTLCELIIFFPTLNIWISAIGKDSITFACINLVVYAFLNIRSRIIILSVSSLLFILIRPFVGLVLIFAISISITLKAKLSMFNKVLIGLLSSAGVIATNILVKSRFTKLNIFDFDYAYLAERIEFYSNVTSEGNFAINLADMPFPLKIFAFMFRPLFFDAKDFYSLLMSFENLIILTIFIFIIISIFKNIFLVFKYLKTKILNFSLLTNFLSIYLTTSWLFYSLTVANLGTANRYKLMFLPALIYLSLIFNTRSNFEVTKKYVK